MSKTADQMAPDASPGTMSNKSGVRRVNNVPMYLLVSVLSLFLLVMAMVAADRSAKQNEPVTSPQERAGNTSMFAKEIAGDQTEGIVAPAKALTMPDMPTTQSADPMLIARPDNLDVPPAPPSDGQHLDHPATDDEAQRIRIAKLQMLEDAIKAKTTVQVIAPRSSG